MLWIRAVKCEGGPEECHVRAGRMIHSTGTIRINTYRREGVVWTRAQSVKTRTFVKFGEV